MANDTLLHPERVLAVCAHPDDLEFGAAGTVARWTRNGAHVVYVVVTDGSKGSDDPEMTGERLSEMRMAEQRAAAEVLGVAEVVFLGYPDGEVFNTPALRGDIVHQIREHRPDVIVTLDPTNRFPGGNRINHPDHIAVGDTTLNAVFPLARDRLTFPEHEAEGLAPHKVLNVLLSFTGEPNEWVDIAETVDVKIAALKRHVSQVGGRRNFDEYVRERARATAEGTPFEYAEAFRRITLKK